jgi:D-glycero-D-manno-heptose 1,7-bisphosphate phosphatase
MKKAIFIDRDGTLIQEVGYLKMMEDLRFTPRAAEALQIFKSLGYLNIVITNQSAVARGILSPRELEKIHRRLRAMARDEDAAIHDILCCPHFAGGRIAPYNVECECRKPKPGMLLSARDKHGLDLAKCYVVGDKASDLELAANAGARGVLVLTGYGAETRARLESPGTVASFRSLYEFALSLRSGSGGPA